MEGELLDTGGVPDFVEILQQGTLVDRRAGITIRKHEPGVLPQNHCGLPLTILLHSLRRQCLHRIPIQREATHALFRLRDSQFELAVHTLSAMTIWKEAHWAMSRGRNDAARHSDTAPPQLARRASNAGIHEPPAERIWPGVA